MADLDRILKNRFYVGAETIIRQGSGFATLPEAIAKAEQRLASSSTLEEVYVVNIIRVVRRQPPPVDVIAI